MILLWKIRYLDTRDKELKDRDLYIDTDKLDSELKHSIEFSVDCQETLNDKWAILPFRKYFQELDEKNKETIFKNITSFKTVGVHNYHEDEDGNPLTITQLIRKQLDKPKAIAIPNGWDYVVFPDGLSREESSQFGLGYLFPVLSEDVNLSEDQIEQLKTYSRCVTDLVNTSAYKEPSAFSLSNSSGSFKFKQSITDDDLRAFVMCFRKLYLEKEPANFIKICKLLALPGVLNHPVRDNIIQKRKDVAQYQRSSITDQRVAPVDLFKHSEAVRIDSLVDSMLYTKFIHQPDEINILRYKEACQVCLGNEGVVWYLFCVSIMHMSSIYSWVNQIVEICLNRTESSKPIQSNSIEYNERPSELIKRQLYDKIDSLAEKLWIDAGRPDCGQRHFKDKAQKIICEKTGYSL